jgi:Flp pilus assembly protein protease CpaA
LPGIGEIANQWPILAVAIKVLLTLWMVSVAVIDIRTARIPNALVGPVMLGMGAVRAIEGLLGDWPKLLFLLAWLIIFGLWMMHFIGGGDAKFLMGLYALFPDMDFTGVLALILLVLMIPLLVWEFRKSSVRKSLAGAKERIYTQRFLPTEKDLAERGRQNAWTFAVPGIVYTWLYW